MQWFRVGLVLKAHRLLCHSTGAIAGLEIRRILNEPTAAALAFGVQPPYRNVQWFRGGLVFEAHRLLYHSA